MSREYNIDDKLGKNIKVQMIQTTDDGISCTQKLNVNQNSVWQQNIICPSKLPGDQHIYTTGDDVRVFNGQIRNFKFFTNPISG